VPIKLQKPPVKKKERKKKKRTKNREKPRERESCRFWSKTNNAPVAISLE
jgi:hypothetical protein